MPASNLVSFLLQWDIGSNRCLSESTGILDRFGHLTSVHHLVVDGWSFSITFAGTHPSNMRGGKLLCIMRPIATDSHWFSQLSLNDLKHMRLTCKTLANDAASLVLSHISIPAKEATKIEDVVSDLQFLAKAAANCPSKITINDFSSIFRNSSPEDRELECNTDKGDANAAHGMKRISQDFLTALASFKIVRTVKYATFIHGK